MKRLLYLLAGTLAIIVLVISIQTLSSANDIQKIPSIKTVRQNMVLPPDISNGKPKPDVLPTRCRVINWQPDRIYILTGSINMATHIIFPVAEAVDPVVGNHDLWNVEAKGNHIFLKPNNEDNPEGKETTMTFIGQDNKSYEFILKRVKSDADTCVIINSRGSLLDNSWQSFQTPDQKLIGLLAAKLKSEKRMATDSQEQIIDQQRRTLRDYRSHIYTKYSWKAYGQEARKTYHTINSVYDDGRWTYVHLNTDISGVMSIYGYIDGHKELLQYNYDDFNKVYQISGVYPLLYLRYRNHIVGIKRLD